MFELIKVFKRELRRRRMGLKTCERGDEETDDVEQGGTRKTKTVQIVGRQII